MHVQVYNMYVWITCASESKTSETIFRNETIATPCDDVNCIHGVSGVKDESSRLCTSDKRVASSRFLTSSLAISCVRAVFCCCPFVMHTVSYSSYARKDTTFVFFLVFDVTYFTRAGMYLPAGVRRETRCIATPILQLIVVLTPSTLGPPSPLSYADSIVTIYGYVRGCKFYMGKRKKCYRKSKFLMPKLM